MSFLDDYRDGLARRYYDDVIMCGGTAAEAAERNGLARTVALRILVPHYAGKGHGTAAIAWMLDVSPRTVERHLKRLQKLAA